MKTSQRLTPVTLAVSGGYTGLSDAVQQNWRPSSGLYYYGYRWYAPNLQRWLNRDPIGERGGFNLYQFAANIPTDCVDLYGMISWKKADPSDSQCACEKRGGEWGSIYKTWYGGI